jgi:hypothetical protein
MTIIKKENSTLLNQTQVIRIKFWETLGVMQQVSLSIPCKIRNKIWSKYTFNNLEIHFSPKEQS